MRKILRSDENPLDNVLIDISDWLCPAFKKIGFTPNRITFLSLLFALISLWFLWRYNMILFTVFYFISYFFDCMDGHFARRYKMTSKGGDMFDHGKDVSVNILLVFILFYRFPVSNKIRIQAIVILLLISLLMCAHLGCQERIYPKDESGTLSFTKKLCIGKDPKQTIKWTRWAGCGTWCIVLILVVWWINHNRLSKK